MTSLTVAAAQFTGVEAWEENLRSCLAFLERAADQGVDLLVLPEAAYRTRGEGGDETTDLQPLTGPFVTELAAATVNRDLTVVLGTLEKTEDHRPSNTLVALAGGRTLAVYRKIHLYDAFTRRESDRVLPGDGPLAVFDVKGFGVGMMTCYDVRFPEVARALAIHGADVLALPASWVSGPLKEMHWDIMTRARAVENTCYVVASGKTGPTRIGMSSVIDPLGVVTAQLGHEEGMVSTTISGEHLERVRQQLPLLQQRRMPVALQPDPFDSVSTS